MVSTAPGGELVEWTSPTEFSTTLSRLIEGIEAAGLKVFACIDHAAGAREAGLSMLRSTVVVYGSPKTATPVMLASPQAALDLPLRTLIREGADGRTRVTFRPVVPMLERAGVPRALATTLAPAQGLLLKALGP